MSRRLDYSFASPRHEGQPGGGAKLTAICSWNDHPTPLDIHVHSGLEVGLVLAGEEHICYEEHVFTCSAGDVWLCSIWEPHGWSVPRPATRTVVLIFPPEFIGEEMIGQVPWLTLFVLPPEDRPRVSSLQLRRRMLEIGGTMRREIEAREPFWESVVRLELLRLLTELSRGWTGQPALEDWDHRRLRGLRQLMAAFALVHSVPWRRVSVGEAAAACGLSVSRFHTVFRKTMNMTFGQFSLRARLSFAAHQLISTERSISAIAAEAGFVDDSHLHHCFAKRYSCTPVEYRRRMLSERERTSHDGMAEVASAARHESAGSGPAPRGGRPPSLPL